MPEMTMASVNTILPPDTRTHHVSTRHRTRTTDRGDDTRLQHALPVLEHLLASRDVAHSVVAKDSVHGAVGEGEGLRGVDHLLAHQTSVLRKMIWNELKASESTDSTGPSM